jgi:hypothetical protein
MPHIHSRRSKPAIAALILLLLAALALAACGSSSNGSSPTSASASATKSTSTSTPGAAEAAKGAISGRFTAMRECLQKNGITLPKRTPGQRPAPGSGGFFGGPGGLQLPKGMTRTQYEAILKKCGGSFFRDRRGLPGIGTRLQSPAVTKALAKFAACMRENGVNVPAPNTSGKGPIFNTKDLNTTSTTFRTAETKCRTALQGAFRARPGAAGAPG